MSKTILFAEDQLEFLAIYSSYLERHGYSVIRVSDGQVAVDLARERQPDLILMDCGLPTLDGIQATERLKRDPATRGIPVVLLTAMSYGAAGRRSRDAGCDALLLKPCEPRRVLEEVHRLLLRQPHPQSGATQATAVARSG